jgi:hypothetical protein
MHGQAGAVRLVRGRGGRYGPPVVRWLCLLVSGGVVSGFAFLLVTGSYLNDGPVLLRLSANHGLHAGDFFVFLGWLAAMGALGWLALIGPRRDAT